MVLSLGYKFFKHFLYNCIRKGLGLVQGTWWVVNGTYFQLWRSRSLKNYDWSAHVMTIWFRHKLDLVLEPSGPNNFISAHHSFQNPKYVLKDNVTLYYVTRKEAVFVETDPSVDAAHSDNGAFLRVAQFNNAKKVIILPIEAFHRLAEKVGDPKGGLIFVTNTTRCGSTLLSQIFEETDRILGFSEPDALNAIGTYRGKIPQDELDKIIINSMRLLCKPVQREIDFYVVKPTAPTIDAVPMFIRIFPDSKQVFMYREGLKVAQSLVRAAQMMPLLELTFIFTKMSETMTKKGVAAMGLPSEMFKVKADDPLAFCAFVWAVTCGIYLEYRQKGIDIVSVKYEDIVKYPLASTQAIFKYCGVPVEWADKAIKALDKDSQRKSPLSMKNLNKFDHAELTPKKKERIDLICDQFNLPRIPEPCYLDGTITHLTKLATTNGQL